jgi:hypothetical protein
MEGNGHMSGGAIFQLVLLALVFVAWAWLMVRTISLLQARGGIGAEFGEWWRSPDDRKDRNTLLFLTFVLAAMAAMQIALPTA